MTKGDRDGAAPGDPHSFPSPFPSPTLYKPSYSQPHSGSRPVGTCPHPVLAELCQQKDLGRFWTKHHRTHKQPHTSFLCHRQLRRVLFFLVYSSSPYLLLRLPGNLDFLLKKHVSLL